MAAVGETKYASLDWKRQQKDMETYLPPLPLSTTGNSYHVNFYLGGKLYFENTGTVEVNVWN